MATDEDLIRVVTAEDDSVTCLVQDPISITSIIEEPLLVTINEAERLGIVSDGDDAQVVVLDESIVVVSGDLGDNVPVALLGDEVQIVQIVDAEDIIVRLAEVFIGTGTIGTTLPLIETSVAVGNTEVCDTVPVPEVSGVKWLITLTDSEFRAMFMEVSGGFNVAPPTHIVYGKHGDNIPQVIAVEFDVTFDNLELRVTNNHTFDIVVKVLRLAV